MFSIYNKPFDHHLLQAQDFRTQGTKVKRKMWVQNMKIKLIVFGIVLALFFIMFMSICRGISCLQ